MIRFIFLAGLLCSTVASPFIDAQPDSKAWNDAKADLPTSNSPALSMKGPALHRKFEHRGRGGHCTRIYPLPYMNRAIWHHTRRMGHKRSSSISRIRPAAVIIYAGDNDIAKAARRNRYLNPSNGSPPNWRKDIPM